MNIFDFSSLSIVLFKYKIKINFSRNKENPMVDINLTDEFYRKVFTKFFKTSKLTQILKNTSGKNLISL